MKKFKPLLFVVMPFGKKRDPTGTHDIDFDVTYERAIKPAAQEADLDVIRADEERGGSIIHIPMFERLLLSEIVVADLTIHNANVFYELGVRHAARPRSTILIYAKYPKEGQLPFDVNMLRAMPYYLKNGILLDAEAERLKAELVTKFSAVRANLESQDSPLFQFIKDYPGINLSPKATETFRDRAFFIEDIHKRLFDATRIMNKEAGLHELIQIEGELGNVSEMDSELLVDLLLSYRDIKAWDEMISLIERLQNNALATSPVVRQLYAFALNRRNRVGDQRRAMAILREFIEDHGHSTESCGMMGRIFKDLYEEAMQQEDRDLASVYLDEAIDWYRRGFEADPRDYYPGINAATLLFMKGDDDANQELQLILAAVIFAVARRGGLKSSNYWDVATVLEAATLSGDWKRAGDAAGRLLLLHAPPWHYETTVRNLKFIRDTREERDLKSTELDAIMRRLQRHSA